MYQASAKTPQTLKSLTHLYKVSTSRTYSSYVKNYTTHSSLATNEIIHAQNPDPIDYNNNNNNNNNNNPYFRENNYQVQHNPYPSDYINKNSNFSENNNLFHQNPNGLSPQNHIYQNKIDNQQSNNVMDYQIPDRSNTGMNYYQPEVTPDENGQLRGTIEEFDGFCKEGKLKEAVEVLVLLERNNVSLDVNRYLFLVNECGEALALEEGKRVHEHVERSVWCCDVRVCNKVLEMYGKCGSMEDAYKVFEKMSQRNLTTWDMMITWLARNGHGEDAIEMFDEFKKIGLKPDDQMFFGVFNACSVLGNMREGLLHFESMSKTYNITPSVDHYKSVVDMLGSAGCLTEALEFIENMPIEPSVKVWETMMNHCRIHGDTELGDRCLELIELLDPSCLDEQSKAGLIPVKASDVAKEKEKKRLSGFNPLEIKTKVYEYRAGDTSHPEHEKLYGQLRCLKQPMKEAGYVPETKFVLHDIDQESKEEALLSHSERLALSQALLTSPARSPIRIIKNLRVCGDCHNALKIISKLVGRLIVARDAKRFHHFENGVCSCGDYW